MSSLAREPTVLPANQVYHGGSAPGVQCASCLATATSGSWRKGWELEDHGKANLCNRCGQRWVKQGKRLLQSGGDLAAAGISDSRLWVPSPGPMMAGAKCSFAAFDSTSLSSMDLDGPSQKRGSATIRSRLLSDDLSPEVSGISTQALTESPAGASQLPLGIDPRQSGHFNYRATPAATATAPPLRCTNRGEVIAWLMAWFGVHQTGAQELIGQVPLLTVADLHKVLGTMPQQEGLGGNWGAAPAAGAGTTPPSPPSLNLNLAPSPFSSFPARSPTKLDRGAKIKPGTAAHAGAGLRAGSGPLAAFNANIAPTPRPTMAAAASPFGVGATPFLPRFRCGACGRDDHATDNCILGCTSPPTLIHNHSSDTVGLSLEPLMLMGTGHSEGLDLDLLERQLLGGADEDSPMQATAFDSFLDVSFGDATVLCSPVGASSPGAVTQPVRSGHSTAQHAEQLTQHQPPRSLEDTIKEWAVTLSGHISETLPVAVQGGRWVPPSEAIAILQQLGLLEVSMEMLERTQISRAVAMLRTNSNAAVALAAHSLAAKWQNNAMAALKSVSVPTTAVRA